jgi:hypothetical protein
MKIKVTEPFAAEHAALMDLGLHQLQLDANRLRLGGNRKRLGFMEKLHLIVDAEAAQRPLGFEYPIKQPADLRLRLRCDALEREAGESRQAVPENARETTGQRAVRNGMIFSRYSDGDCGPRHHLRETLPETVKHCMHNGYKMLLK